jgi:short-subunit dehydrogenase
MRPLKRTSIRETIKKITEEEGHEIDILINCAGVSGHKPILEVDDAFRERIFTVNMTANYVITQEVGRHMIARGKGGKILNVSSLAGMIATKNISAYAGTKGAVNQFTSAFANEWVQVNCLCPGYVKFLGTGRYMISKTDDYK